MLSVLRHSEITGFFKKKNIGTGTTDVGQGHGQGVHPLSSLS